MKYSLTGPSFYQYYSSSKSLAIGDLSFKYQQSKKPKLGLTVSRNYGTAVQRNLFKRRCRHVFHDMVKSGFSYTIIVRPRKKALTYQQIKKSFYLLSEKLNGDQNHYPAG